MEIEVNERLLLGLISVLGLGLVAASAATVMLIQDMDSLESQIENIGNQERVIYVNNTDRGFESIYNQSGDSVVYIQNGDSQGSGFVYNETGYIVTNEHVVGDKEELQVTFTDGETLNADVVGKDVYTDLAVLEVDREDLTPLEFADSEEVNVGQTAIAIGNPFGLESSMTQGIISQKGRSITIEGGFSIRNVLQTDASINPGNSGGPLMNREGEVVGVNTAIETNTGTFSGVGFAIPSNTVQRVVPNIITQGEYKHPWIGVRGQDVRPEIADEMDLNQSSGFLVLEVVEDSPADEAGLLPSTEEVEIEGTPALVGGDVIVGIDEYEVRGIEDVLEHLALRTDVGDTVTLEVIRDGQREEVELTLGPRPQS
ncbi:MAG: trypsin-like peptidase domain-containing protein [Candidatus Nanohaloarchaea archaeon]